MHREDIDRLQARHALSASERQLSGIIHSRLEHQECFSRIRSIGDESLFGGNSTADMKHKLNVPEGHALADFLPQLLIKAKDLAMELTLYNVIKHHQRTETEIVQEHAGNNMGVRQLLMSCGIRPEDLPAAEDIERIERRYRKEQAQSI